MNLQGMSMIIIPEEELKQIKNIQQQILDTIKTIANSQPAKMPDRYITAKEFMASVRICRTKFDQLIAGNKIKSIKKRRKIYIPVTEIDRYFADPTIL